MPFAFSMNISTGTTPNRIHTSNMLDDKKNSKGFGFCSEILRVFQNISSDTSQVHFSFAVNLFVLRALALTLSASQAIFI